MEDEGQGPEGGRRRTIGYRRRSRQSPRRRGSRDELEFGGRRRATEPTEGGGDGAAAGGVGGGIGTANSDEV